MNTTCPYCGVGCGLAVSRDGDDWTVAGDVSHPSSRGRLCSKAVNLPETMSHEGRLLRPRVDGAAVSWDVALGRVATRLGGVIDEHGPDAVAFYLSGQLLTEDYYVANKLMKGFIGSANVDANSRLCMASAVAGYKRAFGADLVPACYDDLELADLVVLVGSNAAWCHPVVFQRIVEATRRGAKLVVIDPRRTSSCDVADLHLAIRPGTDTTLFNGLLHHLRRCDGMDFAFLERSTRGFAEALQAASEEAPSASAVARICGLDEQSVAQFFRLFACSDRTVSLYSMGVNQAVDGTDRVSSIINCHLASGKVGAPGCGPFSLTGQPNAMGGREVGALANLLAAHMGYDPDDIDRVEKFWQAPSMVRQPGLTAVEMVDALEDGRIKAIWVMASNPAASLPDSDRVRRVLADAFVVVSDCYRDTDTARFADVLLPALTWGEKSGTVTNSERCISRQRAFAPPAGEARPDWWMVCQVAKRLGFAFDYEHPAEIFDEHARLSALDNDGARLFDLSGLCGLSRDEYDALEPVQWPVRSGSTPRLFADGVFCTSDGKARLVPIRRRGAGSSDARYPLVLNTGRVRDHWHTMTRTGRSATLSGHIAEPCGEIHPDTAAAFGIIHGGLMRVESALGAAIVRAQLTTHQRPRSVFVPMHWTSALSGQGRINAAVHARLDPCSRQPDLKATPVRVVPVEVAWQGFALSRRELPVAGMPYWVRVQADGYLRYELAGDDVLVDCPQWARRLLCDDGADSEWVEYLDERRGCYRAIRMIGDRLDSCVMVSPSDRLPSREWLGQQLRKPVLDHLERHNLLAGRSIDGSICDGTMICSCHRVTLGQLMDTIAREGLSDCAAVGRALGAGTGCGSCLPEIRELVGTSGEARSAQRASRVGRPSRSIIAPVADGSQRPV